MPLVRPTSPVSAASSGEWVRPADWLAIPTPGTQEVIGLVAIPDAPTTTNAVSLRFSTSTGTYHVDWGDGDSEDVASNTLATHNYDYADAGLADTECWTRSEIEYPVTFTDTGDTVNLTAHGYSNGQKVRFSVITTTTGISTGTTYYIVGAATNTFQVASTLGGDALALTTDGSGVLLLPAYKQALVRVTPNTGNLTTVDLCEGPPWPNGVDNRDGGWLDLLVQTPNATTIQFVGTSGNSAYSTMPAVERVRITAWSVSTCANRFYRMYRLRVVELASTSAVASMSSMFYNCTSLTTVPPMDTSGVTTMLSMFQGCTSLTTVPPMDTSGVTSMASMFSGCVSLTSVPAMDTSGVSTMANMFSNCTSLTSVPAMDTSGITGGGLQGMFSGCNSLTSVPPMDTSGSTTMSSMFNSCYSLLTIPPMDTSSVTNMSTMFQNCYSLTSVPAMDTSLVTTMASMFFTCYSLTSVPAMDASAVTSTNGNAFGAFGASLRSGLLSGLRYSNTISGTRLTRTRLEAYLDALGIAAAAQTVTMQNLWDCTNTTIASVTTTAASPTITLGSTSSVAVGDEITGTGVSDALSVTLTDSGDTVTTTFAHGMSADHPVSFASITDTTGIVVDTIYYVYNPGSTTFQLVSAPGGSTPITLTTDGTGSLRRPARVSSFVTDTSITLDCNASASGTVTIVRSTLQRWKATLKNWTVTL